MCQIFSELPLPPTASIETPMWQEQERVSEKIVWHSPILGHNPNVSNEIQSQSPRLDQSMHVPTAVCSAKHTLVFLMTIREEHRIVHLSASNSIAVWGVTRWTPWVCMGWSLLHKQMQNSSLSWAHVTLHQHAPFMYSQINLSITHPFANSFINPFIYWPNISVYQDFPFSVGPKVFFLGAGWGLGLAGGAVLLGLGCRELRPSSSQYGLHWCKTLNWSMKEVAQFPLKPLYLKKR